jgi:ABC-type lipoprotein release transport system permease subunit
MSCPHALCFVILAGTLGRLLVLLLSGSGVFARVTATMMLLGLLATWIPARRALGIDPAGLLREE